nr:zinc finger, CCHC-type [Tanacetum cinerariifolium]
MVLDLCLEQEQTLGFIPMRLLIVLTLNWDTQQPTIKEDYFVIINGCWYEYTALNFAKLDKFEGVNFIIWKKKIHFLLSSMSVVYVLTTPMPEDGGDNHTVEQVRKKAKWDNNDYVCRGLIFNDTSDLLFDIYPNVESSKELWDFLKAKYMAEDATSKKFLVSNFTNYKMTDSRQAIEQYNELLGILSGFTRHKMNMDEAIKVSCVIDKLPPSWKDFKHTLKHLKEELTLIELGSHLRIKKSLTVQDRDKPKGNNVAGPLVVNMAKPTCWKCGHSDHIKRDCKCVNVGNKANGSGTKGLVDGSSNSQKTQNMFNKSLQPPYWPSATATSYMQTMISRQRRRHMAGCHWTSAINVSDGGPRGVHVSATWHHVVADVAYNQNPHSPS